MFKYSADKSGTFRKAKLSKANLRFDKGVFVGKLYESDEFMFAAPHGIYFSRTVKRLPSEERNDQVFLAAVKGLPWAMEGEYLPPPREPAIPPPPQEFHTDDVYEVPQQQQQQQQHQNPVASDPLPSSSSGTLEGERGTERSAEAGASDAPASSAASAAETSERGTKRSAETEATAVSPKRVAEKRMEGEYERGDKREPEVSVEQLQSEVESEVGRMVGAVSRCLSSDGSGGAIVHDEFADVDEPETTDYLVHLESYDDDGGVADHDPDAAEKAAERVRPSGSWSQTPWTSPFPSFLDFFVLPLGWGSPLQNVAWTQIANNDQDSQGGRTNTHVHVCIPIL
eukprot:804968-Amphidinium_carterae.1